MDVILKLMEGMQTMQQQLMNQRSNDRGGRDREGGEDEYLRGNIELHRLPEWNPDTAPVDFQDWMLLVQPQMADISSTSAEWWDLTVETARKWYSSHQTMKPLEKFQHQVVVPKQLQERKWSRLERRASTLLLQSLPESQREDVIANKDLGVLAIITKLMVNYQPGGIHETAAVLAALESPPEATGAGEVISGLRKWLRWKRRAEDMGVMIPDPSVLLRGLDKLVGRVVNANPTLLFRLNLTRTTLMIDTIPTKTSLEQWAECLMAEFDQLSYAKKKKMGTAGQPKIRKAKEEEKAAQWGGGKPDQPKKEPPKCKYFLTEDGCKRGKQCRWSHDQRDDQRRCWQCGSTKHFSSKCRTRDQTGHQQGQKKVAKAECEKPMKKSEEEEVSSEKAAVGQGEDMKSLLEEASRMLKGMSGGNSPRSSEDSGEARIRSLQRQLDEMKNGGSMKVLRLSRIQANRGFGLVDSGATHALRPAKKKERTDLYPQVQITLAGGQQTTMRMSTGGVLVSEEMDVEPILPMGALVERLQCSLQWTSDHLVIHHPVRGEIPVQLCGGCPMIDRQMALRLIEELEQGQKNRQCKMKSEVNEELMDWMRRMIDEHPMFQGVPQRLKDQLLVEPRSGTIVGNRRMRKHEETMEGRKGDPLLGEGRRLQESYERPGRRYSSH